MKMVPEGSNSSATISAAPREQLRMAIDADPARLANVTCGAVRSSMIKPELVLPGQLRAPQAYRRFRDLDRRHQFREALLQDLLGAWRSMHGVDAASALTQTFSDIGEQLSTGGAVSFEGLTTRHRFCALVQQYDVLMDRAGSVTLLHSYLNIGNHPEFLTNPRFSSAFLRPLIIALAAHKIGAPLRITAVPDRKKIAVGN